MVIAVALPEVLEHEVVWFNVSMDDATLVQGIHSRQDLTAVVEDNTLWDEHATFMIGIDEVLGNGMNGMLK